MVDMMLKGEADIRIRDMGAMAFGKQLSRLRNVEGKDLDRS